MLGGIGGYFVGLHIGREAELESTLVLCTAAVAGGGCASWILTSLPFWIAAAWRRWRLSRLETPELDQLFEQPKTNHGAVLKTLKRRGENIDDRLPLILRMMSHPSNRRLRRQGNELLLRFFPERYSRFQKQRGKP